jgi:hypothetical protein
VGGRPASPPIRFSPTGRPWTSRRHHFSEVHPLACRRRR